MRNFTVGNAYARTEPMQTAIFASILFGAEFGIASILAIAVAVAGVMVISVARSLVTLRSLVSATMSRVALTGLASGTAFGLAAAGFQQATRTLDGTFLMRAALTLAVGITLQTLVMLVWMILRDRAEIGRILRAWPWSLAVGAVGATATFGWFTAFTLQQAALVKVLAQVEMLFAFGSSVLVFGERLNRLELVGCVLIVASIVVLVVAT
jgi:drug/metabolite transporter (DMT)-like permease